MSDASSFSDRLSKIFRDKGQLCIGIDPHRELLSNWGLPQSKVGLTDFGLQIIEACEGQVGIVKPQVAFFESFGIEGMTALQEIVKAARQSGLLVIADVKRGDIGSTMNAYATAWLSPGGDFESDAITVSPFLGFETLDAVGDLIESHGKGAFVLVRTSNLGSELLQTARLIDSGQSVAAAVTTEVVRRTRNRDSEIAPFGIVLGATSEFSDGDIPMTALTESPKIPILAPGFGFQGASFSDIPRLFGASAAAVIPTVSRSVLQSDLSRLKETIRTTKLELAEVLS